MEEGQHISLKDGNNNPLKVGDSVITEHDVEDMKWYGFSSVMGETDDGFVLLSNLYKEEGVKCPPDRVFLPEGGSVNLDQGITGQNEL
jgi:hypothetical protein